MTAAYLILAQWIDVPMAWLIVWAVLTLLTIALAVLLRTRLRGIKPWQKCAILSLWVHVLLGCLIGAVRIASGGPGWGDGYGPPIQVALLPAEIEQVAEPGDLLQPTPVDEANAPAEAINRATQAEPEPASPPPRASAPADAPIAEDLAAPELLEDPEPESAVAAQPDSAAALDEAPPPEVVEPVDVVSPVPSALPSEANQAALGPASSPTAQSPALAVAEPLSAPEAAPISDASRSTTASGSTAAASASAVDAAAPAPSQLPTPYAARFAPNREAIAAAGGGGANTERAVAAGLAWLAAAQEQEGRWDPQRHGAGRELYILQQNRGGAGAKADNGISSLALLAFLGAGQTHRHGPYALTVGQGLEFLRRSQGANGNLHGDAELFARMYCHSMSSFALSEAFALTQDQRLLPAVRAAAGYSLAVQHPSDGGWRYRPGDAGDTSQLGWQVMALRSAEHGGVAIPEVTWTRVDRFLRQVVRGRFGGLAVYRPEEARPSRSMTAEALFCRQLVTGRADGGLPEEALAEAIGSLVEDPPSQQSINLYYWYYATLALHRAQHASPQAAVGWRTWNDSLTQTLLATQREDGCWPETCLWGGYGGRVYTTALATMCLETYYRYAPPEQPSSHAVNPGVAQRNEWHGAEQR